MNKGLIIFDLNKTLIQETSWYELNLALGITEQEDELLFRLGPEKEGILTYQEWIKLLKKIMIKRGFATRQRIENILLNYTLTANAEQVVKELHKAGYKVAIVSGSFDIVVDSVAKKLDIEMSHNNTHLVFDNNDYLQDILLTWDDFRYKPLMVESLCRRLGFEMKDAYYVADGDNDNDIFDKTIGIAIGANKKIHEKWKQKAIDSGEKFSNDQALQKAKHQIIGLSELINVVKQ